MFYAQLTTWDRTKFKKFSVSNNSNMLFLNPNCAKATKKRLLLCQTLSPIYRLWAEWLNVKWDGLRCGGWSIEGVGQSIKDEGGWVNLALLDFSQLKKEMALDNFLQIFLIILLDKENLNFGLRTVFLGSIWMDSFKK